MMPMSPVTVSVHNRTMSTSRRRLHAPGRKYGSGRRSAGCMTVSEVSEYSADGAGRLLTEPIEPNPEASWRAAGSDVPRR